MYVYFDNNGVLKEIITEDIFRVGDSARDKIYVYWEGTHAPTIGYVRFRLPSGSMTDESIFYIYNDSSKKMVGMELPLNPPRNLKYFSYDHTYEDSNGTHLGYMFYVITLPDEVLESYNNPDNRVPNENNLVVAGIRFLFTGSVIASLGAIPFAVEETVGILADDSINISQYNYLLKQINSGESSFALVRSATENINGYTPTGFSYESTSITLNGYTYSVLIIKYDGEKLDEEKTAEYMTYMTGIACVPVYDWRYPKNVYFLMTNGNFYKPQYDNTRGLVLFNVGVPYLVKNTTDGNAVYGVSTPGTQVMFGVGQGASANKIPQRTSGGQINVPLIPTDNAHATSKSYVDTKSKLYAHTITMNGHWNGSGSNDISVHLVVYLHSSEAINTTDSLEDLYGSFGYTLYISACAYKTTYGMMASPYTNFGYDIGNNPVLEGSWLPEQGGGSVLTNIDIYINSVSDDVVEV